MGPNFMGEEAIDTIVERFGKIKKDFGPGSAIFTQGIARDTTGLKRLADSFYPDNSLHRLIGGENGL